ncbi:DUF3105 domain-containing protein [Raineyella fluvialis]|uniref:DUF3105 domain-containing protein n=1 Tax=Raineyella fluvialis TaxID=2662261 RepID=UPI001E4BD6EA|nr:DUF3105 domain-containing protein [Raineyella fluvialis]
MTPDNSSNRRARLAALQAADDRKKRRRRLIVIIGGVVAALAVVAAIAIPLALRAQQPKADTSLDAVKQFSGLSNKHTTSSVSYPMSPPVGGDHDPTPQNCGVYTAPVRNENAVHSLEHGAVWITYTPDLAPDQVSVLQADAKGHTHVLVSPYPGLGSAVVLNAWGLQLPVDSASDPRVAAFIKTYEQGPQTPEPGAECSGGTGTPLS